MDNDLDLIRALRMTADPPQACIDAAVQIPSTLGALERLDTLIGDPAFQAAFVEDPAVALLGAGLPATAAVVAAIRDRIA